MRWFALTSLLVLVGCAAVADDRSWYRLDGQPIAGRPAFIQKFEIDLAVCRGETAKADNSDAPFERRQKNADTIMGGCMAQRGYTLR